MKKMLLLCLLQFNASLINVMMANPVTMYMSDTADRMLNILAKAIVPPLKQFEPISSVAYNPNGLQVLVYTEGRIMLYDIQGELLKIIVPKVKRSNELIFSSAIYSPDGSQILVIVPRKKLMIYDLHGNLLQTIIPQGGQEINSVAYDPRDGSHILVASYNSLMIYDLQGNVVTTIISDEEIKEVAYGPNGYIFADTVQGKIIIYDSQGNVVQTITPKRRSLFEYKLIAYSSDNSHILINTGVRLLIYDVQGNELKEIIPYDESFDIEDLIHSAVYNKDASQILITTNSALRMYDLQGILVQEIRPKLLPNERIVSAVYSPDGTHILVITDKRLIFYPNIDLQKLPLDQRLLILKASEAWKTDLSYIVLDDDEIEVYDSLPEVLKDERLFMVPFFEKE